MRKLYSGLNFVANQGRLGERPFMPLSNGQKQVVMGRLTYDNSISLNLTTPVQPEWELEWDMPRSKFESKSKNFYDLLRSTHEDGAECTIKRGQYVKSFDGKSYKLPMTTCYTILAKDCVEDSKFALMAKKIAADKDELKLKFITQKKVYELYRNQDKMVVKVDDMIVRESELENYGIYRIANQDIYEIRCDFTAASVRFDGINIIVRIGDEYMNRQCGICGHYNGDRTDELRKSDNEEARNLREFHSSYLYTGADCDPSAIEALERDSSEEGTEEKYQMDVDEDYNTEDKKENIQPVQKTQVYETHNDICFSRSPVPECPEGSSPSESRNMNVVYNCVRRSSKTARAALANLRTQDVVQVEAGNKHERRVEIPTTCISAY
uniref:VWFD domain-containing protein n=1 Tax=Panagrolaimus sp. JU765 TaxID=591449 RepID=A0AC34R820_9BILA